MSDPILFPVPRDSTAGLQQDIARTRADLAETVTALAARFDPATGARSIVRRLTRPVLSAGVAAAAGAAVWAAAGRWGCGQRWAGVAAWAAGLTVGRLTYLLLPAARPRSAMPGAADAIGAEAPAAQLPPGPIGGDAVDVLVAQHRRIEMLFAHVAAAQPGRDRREAFAALVEMLNHHEHTEQEIVHPVLLDAGGEIIQARMVEEETAARSVASLISRGPDDPSFPHLLAELTTLIRAHAAREETLEFPLLRTHLPDDRRQAMAAQINARTS